MILIRRSLIEATLATPVRPSRARDIGMMTEAGTITFSNAMDEPYAADPVGASDAVMSSSTRPISLRMEEAAKVLMPAILFLHLPKSHSCQVLEARGEPEAFGTAGNKVSELDEKTLGQWHDIDRRNNRNDYDGRNANCAELLKLAEQVA